MPIKNGAEYIQSLRCEAASLDEVLHCSRLVFVVAGATSQNHGFLGAKQFSSMQPGTALVLVSRAAVVDFEAMLDFAKKGHIRVATDVFPEEPLPPSHWARHTDNVILSAHQAGAMETANQLKTRLGQIKRALHETPAAEAKLSDDAASIEKRTNEILRALRGDTALRQRQEILPPSIVERVGTIVSDQRMSTSAPTQTQKEHYAAAAQEFEQALQRIDNLEKLHELFTLSIKCRRSQLRRAISQQ